MQNLERVGGREDGKGNRSKGETKAECKNWWMNCEWRTLPLTTKCFAMEHVITKTAVRKTIMTYHKMSAMIDWTRLLSE